MIENLDYVDIVSNTVWFKRYQAGFQKQ